MKKSSNNKFHGKKNKGYKQDSDFGYYSKNTNRSEKNEKFLNNSAKNKNVKNLNKNNTFSSLKRRKPIFKSNTEFSNKNSDIHREFNINKNFDDEKKLLLIESLWEIVLSDGKIHDYESNLIRRLAGLLYISDINSGNARKRALNKIQN